MSGKADGTDSLLDPFRPADRELQASVADGFTLAAVGDCISPRPLTPFLESDVAFAGVCAPHQPPLMYRDRVSPAGDRRLRRR
jgi:hypothetical protein